MSRRRFLASMAGAATAFAAPSLVRAQASTDVKIATGVTPPSIHDIFLHVAYERGFFRDNGIDVREFIQLRGGPLAIQAHRVAPGRRRAGRSGGLAGGRLGRSSDPRRLGAGRAALLQVAVREDIKSVADLRGKPFAISRPGAISQYLMYPLLDTAGVARDSVQWVGVGGALERLLALQADRVKGALLHVDFAMEAVNDPKIKLIKSVADILPDYPVEMLVLRKDMLERNPQAATAITRAVIQACRYIVQNKAGTIEVVLKYVPGMNRRC